MVDPIHLTNFNRTVVELEETLLWSLLVAGKNALNTAKSLEIFLASLHWKLGIYGKFCPFHCIKQFIVPELQDELKASGIGCHTMKGRAIHQVANSGLNLRTCTTDQLEEILGIGPKTSRMFILHTRLNAKVAVLDVHILRYMADAGFAVPKNTPSNKKSYKQIEGIFLQLAKKSGKSVAEYDLYLWNLYRSNNRRKAS